MSWLTPLGTDLSYSKMQVEELVNSEERFRAVRKALEP